MSQTKRIGIIGGGIAGLSSAWALTKAGYSVTLFEQGPIPNPVAASGDQHRIIRRGYGSFDGYARTIEDGFAAWERLWQDLGVRHYRQTGVLCVSQAPGDEADYYTDGYDRMGTPYQRFTPADAAQAFPYLNQEAIHYATYADDGGVLFCERIAKDLSQWLIKHGATIHTHCPVIGLDCSRAEVTTEKGCVAFDELIVTAGAWTGALLPDFQATLTSYRTAVVYLKPPPAVREAWSKAPAFLSAGGTDLDGYILPPVDGTGLKFGAGKHKRAAAAGTDQATTEAEGIALRDYFHPVFRDLDQYEIERVRSCAYTFTADEKFFGARKGNTWVVSACSGHGYKFGAAVGEHVARAVRDDDGDGLIRWLEARVENAA